MGKQPAAPQPVGGDEPRSRARGSGTAAPSTRGPPPQERRQEEIVHGVRHAVAPRDGGVGTSATVAGRRTRFMTQETEGRQSPVHGDAGAEAAPVRRPRPSYLPARLRWAEEGRPHAAAPWSAAEHPPLAPALHAAMPEEPQAPGVGPAGVKPAKTFNTQKTIERTSTLRDDDDVSYPDEQAAPGRTFPAARPLQDEPRYATAARHPRTSPGTPALPGRSSPSPRPPHDEPGYASPEEPVRTPAKSPMLRHRNDKKRQPMAFCFTACCILFWLLVIAVGAAVLIIFLIYHPQSPKMRVTSATLNAGYIDELGIVGGARALNADLTVLAAIYNPNTKLHVVLRYMQLDLYFQGSMIGTQAVWPAPLHEGPRGSVLRSVHLVVSEVTMTQEDVYVWQNATSKGGPVVLHLAGRFRAQLIFGRWFRFNYWVSPQCTLWLDPPPSGALRRARCS
uniref:Late embryogenesis abundant protein LEA-2 subgroup domain-containing protein n=1 Tax=Oryza punctata TaxID=4537 RepID=A0A0E0JSJ0_ORYPU